MRRSVIRPTRTTTRAAATMLFAFLVFVLSFGGTSYSTFHATAFVVPALDQKMVDSPRCSSTLWLSSAEGDRKEEERDDLLQKASQLRREASDLESKLTRTSTEPAATIMPPPTYQNLNDSVWTFSYRFSDQPESREAADSATPADVPKRAFYAGKLTSKLRSDGFTDILSQEPASSQQQLDIVKAWGWDVETSNQDNQDYVMFSVDANLPKNAEPRTIRFYFQARKAVAGAAIVLKEGTVTVKQDVVDSKAPLWGFFSPRGILAEFRRVGDFNAKPTRVE